MVWYQAKSSPSPLERCEYTPMETVSTHVKDKKVTGSVLDLEMTDQLVSFYGKIMGFVNEGRGVDGFYLDFLQDFQHCFP